MVYSANGACFSPFYRAGWPFVAHTLTPHSWCVVPERTAIGPYFVPVEVQRTSIQRFYSMIIGFAYPAFASFKAIESKETDDDTQWLTYWTVFSFFNILEFFADTLIAWFPFYYEAKVAFIVWLQLPQTLGAQFLYVQFIQPFLKKHEGLIDKELDKAGDIATAKLGQATAFVKDKVGDAAGDIIKEGMARMTKKDEKDE